MRVNVRVWRKPGCGRLAFGLLMGVGSNCAVRTFCHIRCGRAGWWAVMLAVNQLLGRR